MTFIPDRSSRGVSKQLDQRDIAAAATSHYSPGTNIETVIAPGDITLKNYHNQDRDIDIYVDHDGTTYGNATYVATITVPSRGYAVNDFYIRMNNSAGNIAMKAPSAGQVTATINGIETDVS